MIPLQQKDIVQFISLSFISFIAFSTFCSIHLFSKTLSLKQAIQSALQKNRQYQSYQLKLQSKKQIIQKTNAAFYYPNLNLNGQAAYQGTSPANPLFSNWQLATSLDINKVLYSFGQLSSQISLAQKDYLLTLLQKQEFKQNLVKNVKIAFYKVLLEQKTLKTLEKSNQIRQLNLKNQKNKFEQGRIPEYEYIQLQIQVQKYQIQVQKSKKKLIQQFNQLFHLIGLSAIKRLSKIPYSIQNSFPLTEKKHPKINQLPAIPRSINQRTDVRQMKIQNQSLQIKRNLTSTQWKPVLSIFGQLALKWSQEQTIRPQTPSSLSENLFTRLNYKIGLSLRIPLWDLIISDSKTRSQVKSIEYEIKANKKTLANLKKKARTEIINNYLSFQESKENIQNYQEIIQLSQKNFQIAFKRYNRGLLDFLNYRDIETSHLNNQLDFYKEIYNYNIYYLNLLQSMGQYSKLMANS